MDLPSLLTPASKPDTHTLAMAAGPVRDEERLARMVYGLYGVGHRGGFHRHFLSGALSPHSSPHSLTQEILVEPDPALAAPLQGNPFPEMGSAEAIDKSEEGTNLYVVGEWSVTCDHWFVKAPLDQCYSLEELKFDSWKVRLCWPHPTCTHRSS
jgi:hypothetical protein